MLNPDTGGPLKFSSLKNIIFIAVTALVPTCNAFPLQCPHPFVFFDLGQTVIDTATNKYNPMFLMPGAGEYMARLRQRGIPMGIISDIPQAWGRDTADVSMIQDLPTAKWVRTLYFLQGRYPADKTSWMGAVLDPTNFGQFVGQGPGLLFRGRVLQPMNDTERKRNGSMVLFQRARAMAAECGCRAIFLGEDASEIALAHRAGISAFWVGHDGGPSFYLPVEQIDTYNR